MEANELRYRNYVRYKGKVFQVNDIFGASGLITVLPNDEKDRPGRLAVNDKDYKPIPISSEWLERFSAVPAFPNDPQSRVLQLGELSVLLQTQGNLFLQVEFNESEGMTIQYVHQLQNLYFALTGQELTAPSFEKKI